MISINPIFFLSNSISEATPENSTKLFKNSKYLFADLIKVDEKAISGEEGFPEFVFKSGSNSYPLKSESINNPDEDNSAETELNMDFYPFLTAMHNLQDDTTVQISDIKTGIAPEFAGTGTIKFKGTDKNFLKKLFEELTKNPDLKFLGFTNPEPGKITGQNRQPDNIPATDEQTITALQIEEIIDQMDAGSSVFFESNGTQVAKLFSSLKQFINQQTPREQNVITKFATVNANKVKNTSPIEKNKIDEIFNALSEKDKIRIGIEITKNEMMPDKNSSIKNVLFNQPENLKSLKESLINELKNPLPAADQLQLSNNEKTDNGKGQYSFSVKFLEQVAGDKEIKAQQYSFVTKDALKTLLQRNNSLQQLRTRISNVFKNTEQVSFNNETSEIKSDSEISELITQKDTGKDQIGSIQNKFITEEKITVNDPAIDKLNSEKIFEGKQLSPDKTFIPQEEKIKIKMNGFVKADTEKNIEIKQSGFGKIQINDSEIDRPTSERTVEDKQFRSIVTNTVPEETIKIDEPELNKSIIEKTVENKQTRFNQNIVNEEKSTVNDPAIDKLNSEKIVEDKQLRADKIFIPKEEIIKTKNPGFIKANQQKIVEIQQPKLDNVKAANELKVEISKPIIKEIDENKQLKLNKLSSAPEETVKANELEPTKPIIEKTKDDNLTSIDKARLTQHEIIRMNTTDGIKDNKQSDSDFNGDAQEQKKNAYSPSIEKEKSEPASFDIDKKIASTTNEIAGLKETVIDKSIANGVTQTKSENVYSQQKVLNNLEVFSKVSELIQNKDKKSIEIKLDPPELGKMNIRIDHEQNKIYVNIEVKDENVRGMIFHNLEQLKQSINQNGLQLQDFSVSLNGEEQKQFKSSNKNKRALTGKAGPVIENMDSEISAKMMGYNTYDYLI